MNDTVMKESPREPRRVTNEDAQIWGAEVEAAWPGCTYPISACNTPTEVLLDPMFSSAISGVQEGDYDGLTADEIDARIRRVVYLSTFSDHAWKNLPGHFAEAARARLKAIATDVKRARQDRLNDLARDIQELKARGDI